MVVAVKFSEDGKAYNFLSDIELQEGDKVIVETERGVQLAVVSEINKKSTKKDIKNVIKKATKKDYDTYLSNQKKAKEALLEAKKIVENNNLDMTLIDASYSLDRKKLLFNFFADERIDFRDLVKDLAAIYHTRIELHQVGIRDKAKIKGGIGMCGRELCCKSLLNNIESVNINMVKNQNISLNPTKINGACGRLLCCFNYENDVYTEYREGLPKVKDKVEYNGDKCEVISVDILKRTYTIKLDDATTREINADERKK